MLNRKTATEPKRENTVGAKIGGKTTVQATRYETYKFVRSTHQQIN